MISKSLCGVIQEVAEQWKFLEEGTHFNPTSIIFFAQYLIFVRDCTELFESYHSLTDKPREMMSKFLVGTQDDYEPMFNWTDNKVNAFQNEVRQEVRNYFKEAKVDSKISNKRLTQLFVSLAVTTFITLKYYWGQGKFSSTFLFSSIF